MLTHWRRRRGERGQSIVEFAMVAPALILIFFGIAEMGTMFNAWSTVQHAAETGARFAVTGAGTCTSGGGGRDGCIVTEAQRAGQNVGTMAVTVRSWDYPTYAAAAAGSGGPCDAVEVTVTYTYNVRAPMISAIRSSVTMTGRQRFINEPFGNCV